MQFSVRAFIVEGRTMECVYVHFIWNVGRKKVCPVQSVLVQTTEPIIILSLEISVQPAKYNIYGYHM